MGNLFGRATDQEAGDDQGDLACQQRYSLDTQLDLDRDRQRELGQCADYMKGVSALLQKRAPRVAGR